MKCCEYGSLFVTYKWAQKARVLRNTRLENISRNKYSSFLGPFVSYNWAQKARVLLTLDLEIFPLAFLGPLVSYKQSKVL